MATPTSSTVEALANRQDIDIELLLKNIASAGLPQKQASDVISNDDIAVLVQHMRQNQQQGSSPSSETVATRTISRASTSTTLGRGDGASNASNVGLTRRRGGMGSLGVQRPSREVKVVTRKRRGVVRPTPQSTVTAKDESVGVGSKVNDAPEIVVPSEPESAVTTPTSEQTKHDQVEAKSTPSATEIASTPPDTPAATPRVHVPSQLDLEKERIREQEAQRVAAEEEIRFKQQQRSEEVRKRQEAEQLELQKAEQRKLEAARAEEMAKVAEEKLRREAAEAALLMESEGTTTAKVGRRSKDDRRNRDQGDDRPSVNLRRRRDGKGRSTLGMGRRKRARVLEVEKQGGEFSKPVERVVHEVELSDAVTVGELARRMSVKAGEVIKTLMGMGEIVTINQTLDQDTASLVVEEMGHKVKIVPSDSIQIALESSLEPEGEAVARSPVVTVMGHVDHGKTSLLDYIRKTHVVSDEHGGITQHIGAYHVETEHGSITFLDTPGHAAFSAMRARGASATDIVILVCAADDGVMPQTQEAVQHAQASGVPIIVAVNKIDLEGVNPDQVRNQLSALEVVPEEWGGDTQFINVSAETGEGIEDLLNATSLVAEILELSAVPDAPARGVVIESKLDRGRGPVATFLVQNGTLHKGDVVLAGECFGKVRSLSDDTGAVVDSAGPALPVEMLGLNGAPEAGDDFNVTSDERQARQIAETRHAHNQKKLTSVRSTSRLENMFANLGKGEKRILKVVLKADVRGSLEAISQALEQIGNDEVSVQILGSGVGGITESDANMALTYDAVIFGFNVRTDNSAKEIVEGNSLEVRYYSIIYELLDDIKSILEDMLMPEVREEIVGTAEVRDVFHSPRFGQVAGCMVVEGTVARNKKIRVLRDSTVIYQGELESLRRFKDDVAEVRNGFECGIGVRNYNDVREGDKIEVFESREIARAL